MDLIVKQASALDADEKTALGITGIPEDWPIETFPYTGTVPEHFTRMSDTDMLIIKANNQEAYDAWIGSVTTSRVTTSPIEVVTQNEKNDKILKLASAEGTPTDGVCSISIKIPGTPGSAEGRWVAGGYAFTDVWKAGDRITECQVVDVDNILGNGANLVLKTYHDTDLDAINQGWRMWPASQVGGEVEIDPIGGYGFIPAGFYLNIKFELAAGSTATFVACDYWWAETE